MYQSRGTTVHGSQAAGLEVTLTARTHPQMWKRIEQQALGT